MGILDLFSKDVRCPACGVVGAKRGILGGIRCPNRLCAHVDMELRRRREDARVLAEMDAAAARGEMSRFRNPRTGELIYRPKRLRGDFEPGDFAIDVEYRNFRGEEKTFRGDRRTLRRRGKHVSLAVCPTGSRIALDLDRIGNRPAIEQALQRVPNAREARILNYHLKRGTTSPRFAELRRRFPDWSPI